MKRAKHPGGRPPLPPEVRKSAVVQIKLKASEADALWRRCAIRGETMSEFLRRHLEPLFVDVQTR